MSAPLLGLQVWRPLPPIYNESTGTGCYSLVGSQRISSIPEEIESRSLMLTPSRPCNIPFQPGDVLGFYVDTLNAEEFDSDGIRIQHAPGINMVWYSESVNQNLIASTISQTVYLIGDSPPGNLDSFSSVAPAISISIGKGYP